MPTRRWPPDDSAASMTGRDVRPMPVAAKVAPSGRNGRQAVSACAVPGMPPGTPITRSTWTWPPCGGPYLSSSRARVASWPRSKTSYSGTMPRCCICVCSSTMRSHGLEKTSRPKFTVPSVSDAASGSASRTASRASNGSVTAPPLDSWTTRSLDSRTAATTSRTRPRSSVGRVSVSRMCRWMTAAPTAWQSRAVAATSSTVTGSAGTSALADSAPVGATVMRVLDVTGRVPLLGPATAPLLARCASGSPARNRRRPHGPHPVPGRGQGVVDLLDQVVGVDGGDCIADREPGVEPDPSLDHRQRDHAQLVVADDAADAADLTGAGEHRRPGLGEHLADAVQVQEHEAARRPTEVVHASDGLLPPVAALVQVDGGGQPGQLVGNRAVVAVHPEPRPAGLDTQRLVGVEAGEGCAEPVSGGPDVSARDHQVEHVRGTVADRGHAADEAGTRCAHRVRHVRRGKARALQGLGRLRAD